MNYFGQTRALESYINIFVDIDGDIKYLTSALNDETVDQLVLPWTINRGNKTSKLVMILKYNGKKVISE